MKNIIKYGISFIVVLIVAYGCSSNSSTSSEPETGAPVISSLTADKTEILYGGGDKATINCIASGGNLKYVWQVDLGDIVTLNSSHSQVQYTGAACCEGEKIIKCTVSNSLGSVSKEIKITILKEMTMPAIVKIESNKSQLSIGDSAYLECYASGGSLSYKWSSESGAFKYPTSDSSKVNFLPSVLGKNVIKCIAKNAKGSYLDSIQINVVN